jgi:hypothetical protein
LKQSAGVFSASKIIDPNSNSELMLIKLKKLKLLQSQPKC